MAIRESVSTLSALRFSKDTEIEQSVSTLSALRFSKDTELEQSISSLSAVRNENDVAIRESVSTLSALRFSKDTEIEQSVSTLSALRFSKDTELEQSISSLSAVRNENDVAIRESVSTLSALRFSKDTEIEQSVSTLSALRFSKDTEIEQSVSTLSALRNEKDVEIEQSLSTLSALRFSKDTEIENSIEVLSAVRYNEDVALSTALADKFEKKQVFTLDSADSLFYAKDGLVPTTAGQLYIDENGFLRVAMPDINGMSTLNGMFDTRIQTSKDAGNYLDADIGFTDPTSDSLSSLYEYYSFVVATLASPYVLSVASSAGQADFNNVTYTYTPGYFMIVASDATQSTTNGVILSSDAGASDFNYLVFTDNIVAAAYTDGDGNYRLWVVQSGYTLVNSVYNDPNRFDDASHDGSTQDFDIDGNTYTYTSGSSSFGLDMSDESAITTAWTNALVSDYGYDAANGSHSTQIDGYFDIGSDTFVAGSVDVGSGANYVIYQAN